jgi:hypothetical protein
MAVSRCGNFQRTGREAGEEMNCINEGGVNDCHWNVEGRCTSYDVTRNPKESAFSRDWYSKQNCTLTQIGVHLCGAYLAEGVGIKEFKG